MLPLCSTENYMYVYLKLGMKSWVWRLADTDLRVTQASLVTEERRSFNCRREDALNYVYVHVYTLHAQENSPRLQLGE